MSDLSLASPAAASPHALPPGIGDVLMESRQRWQHLVNLAADLAFETDADGRFVLIMPDTALGWPAGSLIGQPSRCQSSLSTSRTRYPAGNRSTNA